MNKNIKRMFFVLTLVTLLATVGVVCAADDSNSTAAVDSSVSDVTTVSDTTNDQIAAETVTTTSNNNNKVDTKTIEKNVKKDSITIDGIEYDIIENKNFEDYDEYHGNKFINNCTFNNIEEVEFRSGQIYLNNSLIDNADGIISYNGNITINNCIIIKSDIRSNYQIILLENNTIDINSNFKCNGMVGTITYSDCTFKKNKVLTGNYIIKNAIIKAVLMGYGVGNLTIGENVTFTENGYLEGFNNIYSDNMTNILPYTDTWNGNYVLENIIINKSKINRGNITFNNCTLNATIGNYGTMNISDDTVFGENFAITGNGTIITDKYNEIIPYITEFYGEYTFENITITKTKINRGNLTLINCSVNALISNDYGNLTLVNCSLSDNNFSYVTDKTGYLISNYGNLLLDNVEVSNNSISYETNRMTDDKCGGLIMNNANLTAINSKFTDNHIGDSNQTDAGQEYTYNYGYVVGCGVIYNANRGNISIYNSTFDNNYAGHSGSCIYMTSTYNINAEDDRLIIDNTSFTNNTARVQGGALYLSSPNATITNSYFENNNVINQINTGYTYELGGGAIYTNFRTGKSNYYIENTTFKNNSGYSNGTSWSAPQKYAISNSRSNLTLNNDTFDNCNVSSYSDDWNSNFFTVLNNSNIQNDSHISIAQYMRANVTNNRFTNNGSLYMGTQSYPSYSQTTNYQEYITNNTFINNTGAETIQIGENINDTTIADNTYQNTSIGDTLELDIPNKIYTGEPITITGEYTINNPEYYDEDILEQNKFNIYINGELDQTVDTLEFTVTPTAGTMMVTVQPTISQTRKTEAIRATTLTNIVITPENYNEYIYEGVLIGVSKDTKIKFQGEFNDKDEITIDTSDIIIDGTDATFTNTIFILDAENIIFENMTINNTALQYAVKNFQDNNIISNNDITLINTNDKATAIYNTASNTIISNNVLNVEALAGAVDWESTEGGVADTQAILLLGGNNNTVQNNTINIKSTQAIGYNTLEAITNNNGATNTFITQNKINISGANFNYAIDSLNNVENITITENTITVTGERYCDGIQVGNNANNILIDNNNITCICINTTELTTEGAITYGVIATSMGSEESKNITITNNNINITGTANYGIELYHANTTEIHNNNITVNGPFSMGIGYAYSPNGNATGNNITIIGDSTTPINMITEEFKPENVGIRIQNGTLNVSITDNTITTSDVGGQDTTIHTDPDNVTIANNKLTSSNGYGDDTINAPKTANIENNTIETTTTIEVPETIITNTPVEIKATITSDSTPINGGVVTFTIGNEAIAQVEVIDGVATATVTFKEAEDATITAAYTPESTGLSTSSAEATTSIQAPQTQLNIEDVELTAGETVTLTATVTDQAGNNITGGKVIFKVNGKTVKDTNGKVIYAKVVDGVASVEYVVPDNLAGKDVNITAVYSGSSKYNKESTTITKTVAAQEPTLTITPITDDVQTGSTITLKAKIAAGDKAITTGKIVFKINGKTVKDANGKVIYAKVDANGEVSVDYNLGNLKAGTYTIEATFISPNYDKITSNTTMTVVKA